MEYSGTGGAFDVLRNQAIRACNMVDLVSFFYVVQVQIIRISSRLSPLCVQFKWYGGVHMQYTAIVKELASELVTIYN